MVASCDIPSNLILGSTGPPKLDRPAGRLLGTSMGICTAELLGSQGTLSWMSFGMDCVHVWRASPPLKPIVGLATRGSSLSKQ